MKLGLVGLGRMGGNMATRLVRGGHEVSAFDPRAEARQASAQNGVISKDSIEEVVDSLASPKVVWIMVPSGDITDQTIKEVSAMMASGDVIINGGNSNFHDSERHATELAERGILFVDAGVSGGVWGLENGYCLMVGGTKEAVAICEPILKTLAPENGYSHVGPSGAGHFVKMVHNGIEYAMMQAYAEGFELMHAATEFDLDLHEIASIWRHGSVVRSWLLDLTERALADEKDFNNIKGYVDDSGEGRWTIEESLTRSVPLPATTSALYARFASRQDESYAAKLTAALRNQFGGHAVRRD